MKWIALPLALLAALPLAAADGNAPAPAAPEANDASRPARVADALLLALRRGDEAAVRAAQSQIRALLGQDAAQSGERIEPYFAWAAFLPTEGTPSPRARFAIGERLNGEGLFLTRAQSAGGAQIALTGAALVAARRAREILFAFRHDFSREPILTLPVAAGDEIAVLPLGAPTGLAFAGVTAFDPYFPCAWAGLEGERLDGVPGRLRPAAIHFETDREAAVVRFEIERSARPDAGWRPVAALPATGGGDYHFVDSRPVAPAYYRVVPVLANGLRAAPSMVIALGQ